MPHLLNMSQKYLYLIFFLKFLSIGRKSIFVLKKRSTLTTKFSVANS